MSNILITGGAGFVGSTLAIFLKQENPEHKIIALDNLRRRGSELNLNRLAAVGVKFVHGDVRCKEDLALNDDVDILVECSAEPSVLAGLNESPSYVINSNLIGALNCLELARLKGARFIFLSTSRVYPYNKINAVNFVEKDNRLVPSEFQKGLSSKGFSEDFPLDGVRSIYGATKLSAEQIALEYRATYGLPVIINRCGVITGPYQMARADQGIFAMWMAHHVYKRPLKYIGYGGKGSQVRDLMHSSDLCDLLARQIQNFEKGDGKIYTVGGGVSNSLSLAETTMLCQEISGNVVPIGSVPDTRPLDIPYYVTNATKVESDYSWKPVKTPRETLQDICAWMIANKEVLSHVL